MSVSPFLPGTAIRYAWDSTTLQTFVACPRKYYYLYVLNINTPGSKLDLDFGILYHKALELWEKNGRDDTALIYALRAVHAAPEAESLRKIEWNNPKSIGNLFRAVVWYTEEHKNDNFKTLIGPRGPALELSFKVEIGSYAGESILYCGHLDRVIEHREDIYFVDRKTTKKHISSDFFLQFHLSIQMDGYALGSQVIFDRPAKGGIIEACQLAVGFARFERTILPISEAGMNENLGEMRHWIEAASQMAEAEYFPRNKTNCWFCQFREICSRPERTRPAFIEAKTVPSRIWNPLIPR